jgi:hypothetical protein
MKTYYLDRQIKLLKQGAKNNTITLDGKEALSEYISIKEQLTIHSVSNSALINFIETDAEIAMPLNELMHEDGRHLTKKEYGKVLLKYLIKELREHYC